MLSYIIPFCVYLSFSLAVLASPSTRLRDVYQFPNGTWLENIAVRSTGNVLVTAYNLAQLWEINLFNGTNSHHARLVHQFQNPGTITGITEIDQDIFVTIASNSLWKVDLSTTEPVVNPINITIPAGTLNGMATLNDSSLAISDSSLGLIWRVDIEQGTYDIMIRDNTTATSTALGPNLGVNGIRILDGYLYYGNSPQRSFYRVRVHESGNTVGQPETIAQGVLADDFAVTSSGAYLAGLTDNVITKVSLNGEAHVVAGTRNSTAVMTATSAAVGRTRMDGNVLYITTGGETQEPVNNTDHKGGKIVALKLDI
ncbi:hypothetical protein AFLA_006522 [Aspergillus flavus NRRL3357]|nr:uncharacterized protein G4B84_004350 [Aspergillus flavus NRRL3357]KAF7617606.1 hypothetical protein AFLA_006522 [Aspergillus flavus NRRL3357]QMW29015.1 hypothetical protein G4B84_004350 [Aspergillus flavus NRRL3357]QMW41090.1 hypothetical protein G4B11_004414 [Aspergillus flavus]